MDFGLNNFRFEFHNGLIENIDSADYPGITTFYDSLETVTVLFNKSFFRNNTSANYGGVFGLFNSRAFINFTECEFIANNGTTGGV